MGTFIVGIVVGGVLVYFYHKRKQEKASAVSGPSLDATREHPNKE